MLNILYIEDTIDAQKLVSIYLRNTAVVDCYDKADDILEILAKKKYDIIFMDINLPGKYNGVEAIKLIREYDNYKDTPILALTAYAMVGDKEKFIELGATDYLAKPFLRKTLLDKINEVMQNQKNNG